MVVLQSFAPWPKIKNPVSQNPLEIDEGIVTLIANGVNKFIRQCGRAPTHILLGERERRKLAGLPQPYAESARYNEIFGLQILWLQEDGIWLF